MKRHYQTDRLQLRPITRQDMPAIFEGYAQDPEVVRYMSWPAHKTLKDTAFFLERVEANAKSGKTSDFALELRESGEMIGTIGVQWFPGKAHLGYCMARPYWGRGLMTEAAQMIVDEVWKKPEIVRLESMCHVENHASRRVIEKMGMEYEGRLRSYL
ncbi:MAG: GNAT family N-acetyltransferase, partial [Bacteroidota bacterium]